MLQRTRESGPPFLVPFAWTVVIAAHLEVVSEHAIFVAHLVMAVFLVIFAVTGYAEMREGVLRVWWTIIAVGTLITGFGIVGFWLASTALLAVALVGWMLLPAVGFVVTGRRVSTGAWRYFGGAVGCGLGAVLYVVSLGWAGDSVAIVGLVLVGVGQTAGIVDAAVR